MRWANFLCVLFCTLTVATPQVDPLSTRPKIKQAISLQEAVEIALRESPVLRGAVFELQASEARLQMARSEKRWQLSVNTFASAGTQSGILSSPPTVMPSVTTLLPRRSFVALNAMFMLPLFTGRRLDNLIRQAESVRNATAAQLEAMKLDVVLETKITYRRALLAKEMVRIAEAYVIAMEERVRIDKVAAQVGRIPEFWLLRSEAELANARQMLVNAQRDYEIALIALKATMGIHPDSEITLTEQLLWDKRHGTGDRFEAMGREKLLAEAFAKRPELRAALQQLEAREAAFQGTKSLYLPQVSFMAMADYMRGTGEMGQGTGGYLVGLVLGLTIFDGGRREAAVNEAKAMSQKAIADWEKVKLQIALEVETALREFTSAQQNVKTAEAALKAAKEDERVAKVRYEAGRSVLVEYLDALFALVRAEANYAQALYERAVAFDKMTRALGVWDEKT